MIIDLTIALATSSNIFAAVALIILNKWVLVVNNFRFTTVLTCLHYYASFFACSILLALGIFKYKPANKFESILKIALVSW